MKFSKELHMTLKAAAWTLQTQSITRSRSVHID